MKKMNSYSLMIISAGFCAGLFQNCSKITPQDLAQATSKSTYSATAAETGNLVNRDVPVTLVSADVQPAIQIVESQPITPTAEVQPAVHTVPTAMVEPVVIKHEIKSDVIVDQHENEVKHTTRASHEEVSEEAEAVASCLNKKKQTALNGDSFSDMHGSFEISSNQITEISRTQGKLIVHAISGLGHIGKISQHGGKLVVCNMNIDVIDETNGNIILVNSSVKSITNHRGVVKTYNSIIENSDQKLHIVKQ